MLNDDQPLGLSCASDSRDERALGGSGRTEGVLPQGLSLEC